jgi:hypothetical protein
MEICDRKDCGKEAIGVLGINIPAVGIPIPEHDPIFCLLGLRVCGDHWKDQDPQEFVAPGRTLRGIVVQRLKLSGLADPDFARAFMSLVDLENEDWKAMKRNREQMGN